MNIEIHRQTVSRLLALEALEALEALMQIKLTSLNPENYLHLRNMMEIRQTGAGSCSD